MSKSFLTSTGATNFKVFIPGYMFSQNPMSNEKVRKSPIFQRGEEVRRPGDGMYINVSSSAKEITAEIERIFPSGFSHTDWKVELGTFA